MRIHRGLTVVITLLAAIAVAMQVDLSGLLAAMERGFGRETIFAFFCILLNFYLSFVRFRYSFRALGIGVPGGQAARAFVLGHLGNQLIFSVVGQAVGRSAVLAGAGVSPSAITFLSFLERMIALGSLLLFALAGGAYTLGRIVFDVEGGGGYLAYFVLSLIAVVLLYGLANRRQLRRLLAQLSGNWLGQCSQAASFSPWLPIAPCWVPSMRSSRPMASPCRLLRRLPPCRWSCSLPHCPSALRAGASVN